MVLNSPTLPYTIRAATKDDEALIFDSWLRGGTQTTIGRVMKNITLAERERNAYWRGQTRLITKIIHAPKTRLFVAAGPGALVLGWVCGVVSAPNTPLVLHWVHVKRQYRALGVAKALVAQFGPHPEIVATHWTELASTLRKRYPLSYDPFTLMEL